MRGILQINKSFHNRSDMVIYDLLISKISFRFIEIISPQRIDTHQRFVEDINDPPHGKLSLF